MSRSVGKLCPVCQPSADAGFYSSPGGRLKKSRTSRALRVRSPRPCETSRVRVKNESKSMPVKTSPIPSSSWRTTRALAVRERGEQPSGEVMRTPTLSLSGILRGRQVHPSQAEVGCLCGYGGSSPANHHIHRERDPAEAPFVHVRYPVRACLNLQGYRKNR